MNHQAALNTETMPLDFRLQELGAIDNGVLRCFFHSKVTLCLSVSLLRKGTFGKKEGWQFTYFCFRLFYFKL